LVVVADSKRPDVAFLCPDTSFVNYAMDALGCERTLSRAVFGGDDSEPTPPSPPHPRNLNPNRRRSVKLRCASCLLRHTPNASIVLVGSLEGLGSVVLKANEQAKETCQQAIIATTNNQQATNKTTTTRSSRAVAVAASRVVATAVAVTAAVAAVVPAAGGGQR
jgi:hypothetical protein